MIEIKNDQLNIDGKKISLNDINIIHQVQNNLHLSNSIVEFAKNHEVKEVFEKLTENELNNFILINRSIVNLDNVKSAYIKYYQYIPGIIRHRQQNPPDIRSGSSRQQQNHPGQQQNMFPPPTGTGKRGYRPGSGIRS